MTRKLFIKTYGCQMNAYDPARIADVMAPHGYSVVEDAESEEGKRRIAELTEADVINRSAQHVDLVADFRPGGCGRKVMIDGTELVVRDGVWVVA